MDWTRLLPTVIEARRLAGEVRAYLDASTVDGRRAALCSVEADLLLIIMQSPPVVRLPLIAAAALVRLARG